jgi:putative ABC transport system ATP-binding protein
MTDEAPMLACCSVSRTIQRNGHPALKLLENISFFVEQGATLAVLGASGAGKSTLLRLLNRLDEPSGGQIMLAGKNTAEIDARQLRRKVGMVMQRAYLFPGRVADNVRFGPAQFAQAMTDAEIAGLLGQVGLAGYEQREARTLSGGEAQRVALARALANRPQVLLLDEPTSALDDEAKQGVEQLLLSVVQQDRLTCVWVTHDRAQARRVGQRALLLSEGRVIADGSLDEVLGA